MYSKKVLFFALTLILLIAIFTQNMFALTEYNIPKAVKAPVLDGIVSSGEWDNALKVVMDASKGNIPTANEPSFFTPGSSFNYMWADDGLYFYADIKDNTAPGTAPEYGAALNSGDGIQIGIHTAEDSADGGSGQHLFFTFHPKTSNGDPDIFEHFAINGNVNGTCKIAVKFEGNSFLIEGFIPFSTFDKITPAIEFKTGAKLYIQCVIMDDVDGTQAIYTDGWWFNGEKNAVYTLTDTQAGAIETIAETTTAEAETAETKTETTTPTVKPAAQTFDILLLGTLSAAISAAGVFTVNKIRSKKSK